MTKTLPLLALALLLAAPAARAEDRVALARTIVERTVAKNLGVAFKQAEERSLAAVPAEQADALRPELDRGFEGERAKLVDDLSKEYAQKFSDEELKHLAGIYDDQVYQRFQAINADPNSLVSSITKDAVTRMMNMLTMAVMARQQQSGPGPAPQKP